MKTILLAAALASSIFHASAAPAISLQKVAEGFVSPTALAHPPGENYFLVADQAGVIYKVKTGEPIEPWLDLTPKMVKLNPGFDERGALGLALHPEFSNNGRFFVLYSAPKRAETPATWDHVVHLSEFKAEGGVAKADSEKVLLAIDHPYFNHNGGTIAFGKDGHLYVALGDGGGPLGCDRDEPSFQPPGHSPGGNGQDLNKLLGKILRLDVSKSGAVGIPSDNPVAEGKGRREIYAWGVRNPWRISFDREDGRLFAADIGQEFYEEVNIIKKGGNYGWPLREGFHCFDQFKPKATPEVCATTAKNGEPLLDPAFEYKSFRSFQNDPGALGISITGGYVYRGKAIPSLAGKYVFADWSRSMGVADGVFFAATQLEKGASWRIEKLAPASHPEKTRMFIPAFGEDNEGELYALTAENSSLSAPTGKTGKVWKIVPAPK